MAKKKIKQITRKLNVISVIMNPHPKGIYVETFKKVYESEKKVNQLGRKTGFLLSFRESDHFCYGTIGLYTDFNAAKEWIDLVTNQAVAIDQKMFDRYKPEFVTVPYIFIEDKHLFVFVSNNMSPGTAKRFLEHLLHGETGDSELEVVIKPDQKALDSILNDPNLVELVLTITVPNSDENSDAQKRLEDKLKKRQVHTYIEKHVAEKSKSIKPDNELRSVAQIAAETGEVDAKIQDGRKKVPVSTSQFPLTTYMKYNPESQDLFEEILNSITKVL